MSAHKELGKIKRVFVGLGGYQNAQLGYGFELGGEGWGVMTQWEGSWSFPPPDHAKWTEEDRIKSLGQAFRHLGEIMAAAKVTDVAKLEGKPIEAEFNGDLLVSWRILKEVL